MSSTALIVLLVLVVLIVALVAWALTLSRHRRRTAEAQSLRTAASDQAVDVAGARTRAQVAEQEAEAARRALHQVEAAQEDTLRDADRLDPQVDHRSDEYRPS